ncbi:MAG: C39 family peptidase [Patescibacteria group bacterium]
MDKKKVLLLGLALIILAGATVFLYFSRPQPPLETKFSQNSREEISQNSSYALLNSPRHVYQTFNNCGPATLSMILSWYGTNVSQKELADAMRPYQNPTGDDDDKTIFTSEFADWAQKYGYQALSRVNGDIELLKRFTANGIPVVVKTWLRVGEDIGHFRIVRGFDEEKRVIIQDDSYHGPDKRISYFDFLSLWQPFNYAYIIVYTPAMEEKVVAIVGEEWDESLSWKNALARAEKEKQLDGENVYPEFNISTAAYHLGDYQKSVQAFAEVEARLPRRMLWYQIEPILAYQKLKNYQRVFEITDRLLNGGNRAFSELYIIRGEILLTQGEKEKAKVEFEKAVLYNKNLEKAKQALEMLK